MLSAFAFFALSAFAASNSLYTYQAQVVANEATESTCSAEAQKWSQRFAEATQVKIESATCRSEQTITAEGQSHTVYNLGLRYQSKGAQYPYSVMIGKKDSLSSSRLNDAPLYGTLQACLSDIKTQVNHFEKETGLSAVTVTCVQDKNYVTAAQYYLSIEGFEVSEYFRARPDKMLYTFAPYTFSDLHSSRQLEVSNFLSQYGATIVKQSPGLFVYYRAEGPLPVKAEELERQRNQAECEAQLESAKAIFTKAGSKNLIAWCYENRLQVVHEGAFSLSRVYLEQQTHYASFEQCMADQDFILSDVRYQHAVGAICAPNIYDSSVYSMTLYRRGY